jgi:hypothetical protein
MANQGKHKKDPMSEWLKGEEGMAPTKSRGSHVVDSYIKKNKPTLRKHRPVIAEAAPVKPEVPLLREASPPPKAGAKQSQCASWEHLRKLGRLGKLRAPYQYKSR